ncbi:MAG: hypothetical protein V2J26_12685 [Pacificimonas sp.]|jgi:hypothetical protein|nr:hypothetical protein [Pacificimonas sp.]
MKTFLTGAMIAAATSLASPAAAQLQEYEDYTISDSVVELTTVTLTPGQFETYLEGLKATWIAANDVAKSLGHIEDYGIYANMAPSGGAFDLMLVTTYPSTAMIGPSKARYDEFMEAYGQANIDSANETVLKLYNEIREIQGVYMMREVEMID